MGLRQGVGGGVGRAKPYQNRFREKRVRAKKRREEKQEESELGKLGKQGGWQGPPPAR